jgi:hypothetical protein
MSWFRYVGAWGSAGEHRAAAPLSATWIDPFSSAYYFDGWAGRAGGLLGVPPRGPPPVEAPQSWLLTLGWRRHGLISPAEVPGWGASAAAATAGNDRAEN